MPKDELIALVLQSLAELAHLLQQLEATDSEWFKKFNRDYPL